MPVTTSRPQVTLSEGEIAAIIRGNHGDPFAVLGPHVVKVGAKSAVAIRVFRPGAQRVAVLPTGKTPAPRALERIHSDGLFEAVYPNRQKLFAYQLEVAYPDDRTELEEDTYRFGSRLSDFDLHLIGEGRHYHQYERLGAHPAQMDGVAGVSFAVWAPNARRVSVVGDFNNWDGRLHVMRRHPSNGLWEVFVPGIGEGACYKFEVKAHTGVDLALKSDPLAFAFEAKEPRTASVVVDLAYSWNDGDWLAERERRHALDAPISIYEVHLGSWMRVPEEGDRFLTYRELADRLGRYVKEMGYTHVELLPVTEHPFYGSWGYQPIGMFAPTRRHGSPIELMEFVDRLHQQGIGVILDWVPAHFPRDPHGLVYFDGTHLYEHEDPRLGAHQDWGTLIYNFGRNEVANYLIASALFWLDRYHVDGLRVDAVASMLYLDYSRKHGEWVPNKFGGNENLEAIDFIKRFNEIVYSYYPGVLTIAEESTSWPSVSRPTYLGGLGFGYKWNMGWMHDMLTYMSLDPIYRKYQHNNLTFGLLYAWHENFMLPLSHDEVVHLKGSLYHKMPGDDWQKAANLRCFYAHMYGHPGKKLLFMGGEFGQTREWNHDQSLDWHLLDEGPYHAGIQRLVQHLNYLYRSQPALHQVDFEPVGFQWIDCNDWESSTVSYLRRARDPEDNLVFICNFTPVARQHYRLGVPRPGYYRELLNTDSSMYGGSNVGNDGGAWTEDVPAHGYPQSLCLTLPPLSTLVLKVAE